MDNKPNKLLESIRFLVSQLENGETPSLVVECAARNLRISMTTYHRARKALGIKSRRVNGKYYIMSLPDDYIERLAIITKANGIKDSYVISSDWIAVRSREVSKRRSAEGSLRIHFGQCELDIASDNPVEKLTALLQSLGVSAE